MSGRNLDDQLCILFASDEEDFRLVVVKVTGYTGERLLRAQARYAKEARGPFSHEYSSSIDELMTFLCADGREIEAHTLHSKLITEQLLLDPKRTVIDSRENKDATRALSLLFPILAHGRGPGQDGLSDDENNVVRHARTLAGLLLQQKAGAANDMAIDRLRMAAADVLRALLSPPAGVTPGVAKAMYNFALAYEARAEVGSEGDRKVALLEAGSCRFVAQRYNGSRSWPPTD